MYNPQLLAVNLFSHIGVQLEQFVHQFFENGDDNFIEKDDFWNARGDYENVRFRIKGIQHEFSLLELMDFIRVTSQSWYYPLSWLDTGGKEFYHEVKSTFIKKVKEFVEDVRRDIWKQNSLIS